MADIVLSQEQFDRIMRSTRYVESMQKGPARGQEIPEVPVGVPTGEVWVKVTGVADEDFRPEDTETTYYPCVLTEKFVLSDEDELLYGPLDSYWFDYDGSEDEEGRCFSLNNQTLAEGSRFKATPVDNQENQYPVFGIGDAGGCGFPEAGLDALTGLAASGTLCTGVTLTATKKRYNCDGTTSDLTDVTASVPAVPTTTMDVVTNVTASGSCVGTSITITLTVTKTSVKVVNC